MRYDAVVIGGGPGGYLTAVRLANHGLKVALVEKKFLGGECTNWGCIPSKALLEISHAASLAKSVKRAGLALEAKEVNGRRIMSWVRRVTLRSREGVRFLLSDVSVIEGEAKLKDVGRVVVRGKDGSLTELEAKNIVIATGTDPSPVPTFEFDGEHVINNRHFFEMNEIPSSIAIIGAGAIGTELASALAHLGSEVHLIEIMDRILPGVDKDLSDVVYKYLVKAGIKIHTSTSAKFIGISDNQVKIRLVSGNESKEITVDKVLIAAGRRYNTASIGVKEVGVETDGKGAILVNEYMRTSVPTIYAVGDVTGPPLLAHKAYKQGLIAADAIAGKEPETGIGPIPMVIFTEPEMATVGLSEEQAIAKGIPVKVAKYPYTALPRDYTVIRKTPEGFVKVIFDAETGKIMGAAVVGNSAAELIHTLSLAVGNKLSLRDLLKTVYAHPTYSEIIGEVAHLGLGEPLHLKG